MTKEETRILPVPLTEEEKLALGDKIAQLEIEVEEIEADKKRDNELYNGKIKEKSAEALSLSKALKAGTKEEEVNCYWVFDDPEAGKKTLYRNDTAEQIEIVEMDLLDGEQEEATDETINPDDEVRAIQDRQEAEANQ